jgi:hypothetical protein
VIAAAAVSYSPLAEVEWSSRLAAVPRLLDDSAVGVLVREGIRRRTQAALVRHLEGALRILRVRGWAQGEFDAASGAVCLRQAVEEARRAGFGVEGSDAVAGWTLRLMVLSYTGGTTQDLFAWNDKPGRTEVEVVQLVEDALAFARGYEAVA